MIKYNKYIYKKNEIKDPKLRLLINHHAGGSSTTYFNFCNFFPENWDICFLDLPNRGIDFSDDFVRNRDELINFVDKYLKDLNDVPLALFGHSLGGYISFEIAHQLSLQKENSLIWLGISATKPPNLLKKDVSLPEYLNSSELLIKWMKDVGGTPDEFFNSSELLNLFLPVIKNDLTLFHNLNSNPVYFEKLKIPISIFSGMKDMKASPIEMSNWRNFTEKEFSQNEYEGGHFYFQGKEKILVNSILNSLNKISIFN
jgi:surfactin synthase thioesterase subunit